jgi:hypothetical protein
VALGKGLLKAGARSKDARKQGSRKQKKLLRQEQEQESESVQAKPR